MASYIIEEGINFNEELHKETVAPSDDSNVCLISGEPLQANFVVLACMHKFNYVPLYHDVVCHKKKFNTLESKHLKVNELRCPYCRNIQTGLLPYYELPGVRLLHGINWIDQTKAPFSSNGIDVELILKMALKKEFFKKAQDAKKKALEEKKVLQEAKKKALEEKKVLLEEKKKALAEKKVLQEAKKKALEEKKKVLAEKKVLQEEKKKILAEEKVLQEAKKKALAEKKVLLEEKKKALAEKKATKIIET